MARRAAWRLGTLGFKRGIDYVRGKQAWYEGNEPREGKAIDEIWIGDVADAEVPTCGLTERIGSVRARVRAAGSETCVVVNSERVVLGLLRTSELDGDPEAIVEAVMRPVPATFRPSVTHQELL